MVDRTLGGVSDRAPAEALEVLDKPPYEVLERASDRDLDGVLDNGLQPVLAGFSVALPLDKVGKLRLSQSSGPGIRYLSLCFGQLAIDFLKIKRKLEGFYKQKQLCKI